MLLYGLDGSRTGYGRRVGRVFYLRVTEGKSRQYNENRSPTCTQRSRIFEDSIKDSPPKLVTYFPHLSCFQQNIIKAKHMFFMEQVLRKIFIIFGY